MSNEDLKLLLETLKTNKVQRFESESMKVEFHPSAFAESTEPLSLPSFKLPPGTEVAMPSDDELLFASSDGAPEVQAGEPEEV